MAIPEGFDLGEGIYAAWVTISGTKFRGAMHWGPIPTFDDTSRNLEVFLLGLDGMDLTNSDTTKILVEPVKKIRDVINFPSVDALTRQMEEDVRTVRSILR